MEASLVYWDHIGDHGKDHGNYYSMFREDAGLRVLAVF